MDKFNDIIQMSKPVKEIFLASPRGFCAGVHRAIDVVETALSVYSAPLYVNHEIVHNQHVVAALREKGVIFVEDINEVPEGETVIFSAHGVSPALWSAARSRNLNIIDATCPLVTKVHIEAKRFANEGYFIILIGHRNHVEAIGTLGEAPERICIIERADEVDSLEVPPHEKLAYLTQTTLSVRDTRTIVARLQEKFPHIEGPKKSDICYATTNRQEAVSKIAPQVEVMLVIGSKSSSNSNRLKELSEQLGATAFLIDDETHIMSQWFLPNVTRVGLTAGASAPEVLVDRVIKRLGDEFGFDQVRDVRVKDENTVFQLPRNLKEAAGV